MILEHARACLRTVAYTPLLAAVIATAMSGGCGLGLLDSESGGDDHLPTQGAGPYGKLQRDIDTVADEPYVLSVLRVNLRDPSALRRDDGGYRLWVGYDDSADGSTSAIWAAELPALTEKPDIEIHPVLTAGDAWEQGWVGAPSVVELGSGALVMFYEGGLETPAIGRADSADGGATWQKHPGNPLIPALTRPSAANLPDGSWVLFATHSSRAGLFRADSPDADGSVWNIHDEPVLLPRTGAPEAFDHSQLADPWIVVQITPTGRLHYGMFFTGAERDDAEASVAVGWAGSFDGFRFTRFASPDAAVLAPDGASEKGPSVLLEPDRGIMFFNELRQGTQSIAVAVHP